MKRIRIISLISILLLTLSGCGNQKQTSDSSQKDTANIESNTDNKENANKDTPNSTITNNNKSEKDTTNIEPTTDNKKNTNQDAKDSTIPNSNKSEKDTNINTTPKDTNNKNSLKEKVIDYIINGQKNKPEAEKFKWSETFLNKVDIDTLYKQYTASGGTVDDLENFSKYITLNAPILTDWEQLFENDFYNRFGEKVVRLNYLEGDLYQAYINRDGTEIPYVVVSSRTGYFHG